MRRIDRTVSRRRRLRALAQTGTALAVTMTASGLFLPLANAQDGFAEASRQIVPGAAAALSQNPPRLVDPARVLVTLKAGQNRESLRVEATRRQRESAGGAMDAVVAAIASADASGRTLVLTLPGASRESNGQAPAPRRLERGSDFAAGLAPEAARLVGELRNLPQVAAVEPNLMRFPTQTADPAAAINAILGGDAPSGNTAPSASGQPPRGLGAPSRDAARPTPQVDAPGAPGAPVASADIPALSDDPLAPLQWQLFDHSADNQANRVPGGTGFRTFRETHRQGSGPAPVVAIVDTGLIASHPDLAVNRILPGYDFISLDLVANDGDGRDSDPTDPGDGSAADFCGPGTPATTSSWHGSHVAGIAGAVEGDNRIGIGLPGVPVRILPVRVLGRCGGFDADIIDAIRWTAGLTVAGVPDNPNPAKVINMSLGGPGACPAAYQAAVDEVLASGAILVVAAGNEAKDARESSPASCNGVITVAASDARGVIAPYSNFGPRIDVLAPGGNSARDDDHNGFGDGILSLVSGGYGLKNGTSMATPLVSAAVAALVADRPAMTAKEARDALAATALPRSSAECPQGCGAGLIQVASPSGTAAASSLVRSSR
ncbi:S8 family peptidase [Jiella sonneratiae]|uniref:S8 family serine peptidase n=1 Tax=Jiella sonneratiae TaxID=2816856 RepID=A0ABS3J723_9HYPH|nr:S8 family peptidase [Jiella sonneratiae]MBO0905463.1 S8 family serine peptidase [Jiella sonneratiae]